MFDTESISDSERSSVLIQGEGAPHYIPATAYARSWACALTDPAFGVFTIDDLKLLKHVNCSYLSVGKPPTLLALKQHAQALANLIKKLCLWDTFGIVDGNRERHPAFEKDEAFDWLKDLDEPYKNDDESHHLPLWALVNHIESEGESEGLEFHCPLKAARNFGPLEPGEGLRRPYSTHHNLVMHANACLEILDHEYGATGGLMSLLPSGNEEDVEEMGAARNTLLGQWLLHQQHLVARMHELEISYANALDLLNGEAIVPMQILGHYGPDGRSQGRGLVYPQDRFVLANVGDDVFDMIHRLMDKAEADIEDKEKIWWDSGASGDRIWMKKRGGEWYARGLVPVDLLTRFVRLKDQSGKSTIFILPAIEKHPAVAHTRKIEKRPTVVSVATPTWPERVSDIEQRVNEQLKQAKETEDANRALVREKIDMKDQIGALSAEVRKVKTELRFYEGSLGENSRDELMETVKFYEEKMKSLRRILPREFHRHLEILESER